MSYSKKEIRDFYIKNIPYEPYDLKYREFGIITFDGIFKRHLGFTDVGSLQKYLVDKTPLHVYFSSSRYGDPTMLPMKKKKTTILGTDLVFDIDYDHLKNPTKFNAFKQSYLLFKLLKSDFGLQYIKLIYSGKRGFHVHCYDKSIQKLSSDNRREVGEYFSDNKNIEIDFPITVDRSRLIRLPNSIHGNGGVCKVLSVCDDR